MRHAIALGGGLGVPKNCVLVGIESHRLAVPLDILARSLHVGKSALALDHLEMHQFAGRVVNVDEQRAARTAILEPFMIRAVDLDQFATAIPPMTWLIGSGTAGSAILPKGLSGFPCVAGHNGQQGVPLCHDAKNLPYRMSFSISFWRAALP
ncbi:hypothetical protein, partial [Sphingobium yanoikuyae]